MAITVLVFNRFLDTKWQDIRVSRDLPKGHKDKTPCEADGTGACTDPPTFMTCPCHPSTEASKLVPKYGPSLVVKKGLIGNWRKEWLKTVDPRISGCQLIICHGDFKEISLTDDMIEELRCARRKGFATPEPPYQDKIPDQAWHFTGKAKPGQSKYVLLTTPESFWTRVDRPVGVQYSWETWSQFITKSQTHNRFVPALCLA